MRFERRLASASWTVEQVERQIALIEDLLDVTSSQAARRALREARASLQGDGF